MAASVSAILQEPIGRVGSSESRLVFVGEVEVVDGHRSCVDALMLGEHFKGCNQRCLATTLRSADSNHKRSWIRARCFVLLYSLLHPVVYRQIVVVDAPRCRVREVLWIQTQMSAHHIAKFTPPGDVVLYLVTGQTDLGGERTVTNDFLKCRRVYHVVLVCSFARSQCRSTIYATVHCSEHTRRFSEASGRLRLSRYPAPGQQRAHRRGGGGGAG
mmetsp:Transcript_44701/g.74590  ORF Transcript_44701/g.74590 Transcript_44701/m.74590 type:complete len:215 (+) Transcript_44701:617-1261(+)